MTTAPPGQDGVAASPAVDPAAAPRLARSAGLIGMATMTSRVLGLVRDQVMAYMFGAGNAADAFNVAFRIPNLVRDLFAEGAMSAAFVPTFTRALRREGRDAAWRLGNHVINALLIVTAAIVVACIVYAEPLVTLFADDFTAVPGKLDLTILLTRIMLPFLTLVALAAALMGMLNSLNRFFVPALSPAMFNVGSIACMVALTPLMVHLGLPPIASMAIGVVVGGIGQLVLQWPSLHREGFRYRPILDVRDPGLRQVLILMGPGTVGLAATQINVFVNTVLATGEGTGAVSWLNYAFRLMYLPLGIFGVSIATAALPAIARHVDSEDMAALRHEVANGLAMMVMLNVPATLGLIVLARPIVAMLLERGAFTSTDTVATAAALMAYAVGLTGYSVVKIVSPTFYALRESRKPVLVSTLSVLVNVVLNVVFVRRFGYLGLAMGTSLTAFVNAGILLWMLHRRIGGLEGGRLWAVLLRTTVAAVVMAAAAWGIERGLTTVLPGTSFPVQALRVVAAIGGSLAVLLATARLLRLDEMTDVLSMVARRLTRAFKR